MEFDGRIMKVLPMRSGISSRTGNEWHAQPFVFEYFENPDQRFSDKVLLETLDEKTIPQIVENQECRIGFGHRIDEYNGNTYNKLYMYKFEPIIKKVQKDEQKPVHSPTAPADNRAGGTTQAAPNDLPF